jgi:hypothetical protein
MMINSEVIKEFVESNPKLVSRKETSIPGVYLLKYTRKVFYDNLWNEILQECRGTLVNENYNVISRPFTKIFNHYENGTTIDRDEYCTAYRKINGFMAALSMHNGKLIISTTGSTNSPFVEMAEDIIYRNCDDYSIMNFLGEYKTVIVEIVHPNDPHIIPEEYGIYLLGARWNKWIAGPNIFIGDHIYYEDTAKSFGMKYCDHIDARFSDICSLAKIAKHEGYVVYSQGSWKALKIKSPYYLMKKFLARKNEEKLIKLIDNPHEIKKIVDEEYYGVVDHICANKQEFVSMNEQERLDYIRYTFEK